VKDICTGIAEKRVEMGPRLWLLDRESHHVCLVLQLRRALSCITYAESAQHGTGSVLLCSLFSLILTNECTIYC
jgi:hypothetical protein